MSSFASVHFVAWGFGLGWREVVIKNTIVQPSELHKSSLKYSSLWPQKTSGYYIVKKYHSIALTYLSNVLTNGDMDF